HEIEIDLAVDAYHSRRDTGRVEGVLPRNSSLRPDPQDRHEEDRHEKNTCQETQVRAQASVSPQHKSILYAAPVLLVKVACTLSVDKSFTRLRKGPALRLARRTRRKKRPVIGCALMPTAVLVRVLVDMNAR